MRRTGLIEAMGLIYARDLRLAFRRWEQVTQPVVFFVMVTTLFPLALSPELNQLRQVAAGIIWVAALLSALLALEFMFRSDYEDGTLEQLVLSGQPLWWLALIKAAAHWTVSGLPLVIIAPIAAVTLGMGVNFLIQSFAVVGVGGFGSIVGSIVGSVIIGTSQAVGTFLLPEGAMVFMYILMAFILIFKTRGLFGEGES